jgi:hypothetical protein
MRSCKSTGSGPELKASNNRNTASNQSSPNIEESKMSKSMKNLSPGDIISS